MIYALGTLALSVAWLLPGHYFPWVAFQQDALAALGAALVALAAIASPDVKRFAVPKIALLAFALAVVPMLQWLLGMIPFLGDAVLCSAFLVAFALCVVAAQTLTDTHADGLLLALVLAMLGGAIASTGIGLWQWLQLGTHDLIEYLPPGGRVYANITQPNSLASLLALGIVSLLWLFERRRIGPTGVILGVAFLGFGMLMTQSRTGWVFVAGMALWTVLMRQRLALRSSATAVGAAALLFLFVAILWQPLNAVLELGPTSSAVQRMSSAGTRPGNWLNLLDAVWRAPWFGYGWMQVSVAQQVALLDHPPQREWLTYSHNLALDLLIYNGIPLGLALCAAGMWWLTSRVRRCGNIDSWAMLAGIGALLIHAMLEFPLAYAYFLLPFGFMAGVVESRHATAAGPNSWHMTIPRAAFAALLAAMLGMLAWIWIEYLDIEEAARRMRLKEAGYVAGGQEPGVPDVLLLDNQRDFLWFRLTEAKEGMSVEQLDKMRAVSQRFAPPAAMLRYSLAAGLNGREAESAHTLKLLCHMWTIINCDEGRTVWKLAQDKFPKLNAITYPLTPGVPEKAAASLKD